MCARVCACVGASVYIVCSLKLPGGKRQHGDEERGYREAERFTRKAVCFDMLKINSDSPQTARIIVEDVT